MKVSSIFTLLCLSSSPVFAFIGYGIQMYHPLCASSCRAAIASAMLSCSDHEASDSGGHMGHGGSAMTTPACRAGDNAFLTTLAWCMNSTCTDFNIPTWELEKYWSDKTTGEPEVLPKWSYKETLLQISKPPAQEWDEEGDLNFTATVSHATWESNKMTMQYFEEQETLHARYGIVILVTGFATPIVLTLLGYLPFMTGIFDKIKPYIVYPSIVGTYQVRPLPFLFGNAPTVGQGLYIALILLLNIVLTAVNYRTSSPNTFFTSTWQEVMGYLTNRSGVFAFALFPLVVLFSGRNNVLLWVTNWSHSTYMLLHRWIARIFAIQVIIHSLAELVLYKDMGSYADEVKEKYWIWGIVATVLVCVMVAISVLWMRRLSYEVFLILHIILAVLVIVGCWYHVELLYSRKWGYEKWLYATCAVWFFDRLVRVLRIVKFGMRRAVVRDVGSDFVRVDVEGVRWTPAPGQHVYAYFPTLNPLRPWENHPFSVIPTSMLRSRNHSVIPSGELSRSGSSDNHDVEKSVGVTTSAQPSHTHDTKASGGVSMYIKKSQGLTKLLKSHHSMLTLLDGPYHNNHTTSVVKCDRLLLIGGGIGITGLLSWLNCHLNVKLCWSVRDGADHVVHDLDLVLKGVAEKEVLVGTRLDINLLLTQEIQAGWKKIGVVVCGPGGLCDDVRAAVAQMGRARGVVIELEVDAFSW